MLQNSRPCPDCGGDVTRRDFLRTATTAAAAVSTLGVSALEATASRRVDRKPEDLVKDLFKTITDEQKNVVTFGWDHANRTKVSNNWKIVEPQIGKFWSGAQKELLRDIFKGLVSPEGYEKFQKQMKDDYGGFESYHVALFGDPAGQYEWVMSGRHITIRCDGDSQEGAAFGGPIFYGHAVEFNEKPDHPGNVWWPQAKLANRIFESFDGKQREKALLQQAPADTPKSIEIKPNGPWEGIAIGELSKDQKALAEQVMKDLLAPYRASDVEEAMKYIKDAGGLDKIHLAFYREANLGNDEIWDNWKLQGPDMAWYFRGSPHVHTWVNIVAKA
jgi:hypothetical protein